jgi:hypothetical protein
MQILDQAVAILRAGKGRIEGAQVAAKLEALAALGDKAAAIWQGYLANPGAPGDKYALVTWVGADRSKQLYELSLEARPLVSEICAATGPAARFLVLDESPIALAFAGLKEGQTGVQLAQVRLATQQATNKHLRVLADQVRSAKPAAAGKAPAKKAAKPAAKKAVPKKKAAKKPATKRSVAKKPARKAAAKKSPKKK